MFAQTHSLGPAITPASALQGVCSRQPIAVSDISIYICLIDIRSKSKEQLNERRAGLSSV